VTAGKCDDVRTESYGQRFSGFIDAWLHEPNVRSRFGLSKEPILKTTTGPIETAEMDVHVTLKGRGDLTVRIYRQLFDAVLDGRLRPGAR